MNDLFSSSSTQGEEFYTQKTSETTYFRGFSLELVTGFEPATMGCIRMHSKTKAMQ